MCRNIRYYDAVIVTANHLPNCYWPLYLCSVVNIDKVEIVCTYLQNDAVDASLLTTADITRAVLYLVSNCQSCFTTFSSLSMFRYSVCPIILTCFIF